jgi:hypothetical protein
MEFVVTMLSQQQIARKVFVMWVRFDYFKIFGCLDYRFTGNESLFQAKVNSQLVPGF